jgi:hypothetical protein
MGNVETGMMTATELQQWLNTHGAALVVDGHPGALTRQAILDVFANPCAPAVNNADLVVLASRLGCTVQQLRAVAQVESGGAGFDNHGRPKMLFERHLFSRQTHGAFDTCAFSNPHGGGYDEPSWEKLAQAACKDAEAAFASASWGKFQVLGLHWSALGYPSPVELAYSTVTSEAAHYELLARYIEHNGLRDALKALSPNPETCRAFAKGYNGPSYRDFKYHTKLAEAMQ